MSNESDGPNPLSLCDDDRDDHCRTCLHDRDKFNICCMCWSSSNDGGTGGTA